MRYADCYVSEKAIIGKNVSIGKGAIIYDNVEIGDNCFIGPYAIIGEPTMDYYRSADRIGKKTTIGANSIIRAHTTIYEDVNIGSHFQTGHYAIIREQSVIGHHTSFGSGSELPGKSKIGNYVRLHSNVMLSEHNLIEDYVWIFPFVVLTNSKYPPHGNLLTCHIKQYAQIFSSSVLLPGLTIGENAIVGAGALVTKDVPDYGLAVGYPAKIVKDVRELKDDDGERVYPWRDYLKEYRGYPWQDNPEQ
ncbi:N-acetyltransferase [Candidatus Cloacimonadaceae bacterium]